ncbi:MAG: hypothetical protein HRU12_19630 [Phaeodactylibacter sp.]|nr:hypothetical protein [Phaeodactylibacter sp.]
MIEKAAKNIFPPAIMHTIATHERGQQITVDITYLDDANAVGGDYAALLWIQALVPEMQSVGLYLNLTKSKLLVPRRSTVEKMKPEVAASYNALGFKVISPDKEHPHVGLTILGVPISTSPQWIKQQLRLKIQPHIQYFRSITAVHAHNKLTTQKALFLLRSSLIPKMGYIMRTTPPLLAKEALSVYDSWIIQTYAQITNQPAIIPDDIRDNLHPEISTFERKRKPSPHLH